MVLYCIIHGKNGRVWGIFITSNDCSRQRHRQLFGYVIPICVIHCVPPFTRSHQLNLKLIIYGKKIIKQIIVRNYIYCGHESDPSANVQCVIN